MDLEPPEPIAEHRGWRSRLRSMAIDIRPLKGSRDFRALYIGSTFSFMGSHITFVAVPFQVYEITRSSFAVGLIGLCELVPLLTLSLIGGAIADAVDRRRLLIVAEIVGVICAGLLALNSLLPEPRLWALYALTTVYAAQYALSSPAFRATTPRLVPTELLTAAAALRSIQANLAAVVGPAIGGILLAVVGVAWTYGIDAISFVLSLVAVSAIAPMPAEPDAEKVTLRAVFDGIRFLRGRKVLQGSFYVDLIAMIFGMPNALFPAIADSYGGPGVLGILYSAPPAGALLASVVSGWTSRIHKQGIAVYVAVVGWGAALLIFGVAESLWLALGALALAGAADAVSAIFRSAILQTATPAGMMGRLHGVELTVVASGPSLGDLEAGLVASLTSVRFSIVSGGIACIVGVGLMALLLPQFGRYDARDPSP
jgi:MFS family permease